MSSTRASAAHAALVERTFTFWTAVVLGLISLASLVLVGKVYLDDSRVRAQDSEQENKRNQEVPPPNSKITGSSGSTDQGSLITVSGGARG